jgi:hypothetical protein
MASMGYASRPGRYEFFTAAPATLWPLCAAK